MTPADMTITTTRWTVYESPLGPLTLCAGPSGLMGLHFPGRSEPLDEACHDPGTFAEPIRQLDEYFAGTRREFTLALELIGTPFQRAVWDRIRAIPYGTTVSYTRLAHAVGRPDRIRAVAAAVGRTPVPIIVPCHRAVGADGALTGYLGGLQRKRALLDLEHRGATGEAPPPDWSMRQIALL
jgi:methylated-DNA-[protein]-cysteine S-methyltransferase